MDEQTMFELLEIRDAVDKLRDIEIMMTGCLIGGNPGESIMGNMFYIDEIISRHSPLFITEVDYMDTYYGKVLEDKEMNNHRKARILLGIAE